MIIRSLPNKSRFATSVTYLGRHLFNQHSVSPHAEKFIHVFLMKYTIPTNLAFFHLCVLCLCEGSFFLFPGKRGHRESRS